MIAMNNVMLNQLAFGMQLGVNSPATIDIYSGAMPTVISSSTWSAATYSSQLLCRVSTTVASATTTSPGIIRLPALYNTNATATGTATWFSWYLNGNAIIGTVTDTGPNIAPMYINNVNLVSGTVVNVIQVGFKFSFV